VELSQKIKQLVRANDIDYVGIAPVERFKYAPRGHKPADLLPGAQSVISIGVRISQGPQLTQRLALADLSDQKLRHISFSYRWFGYGMLNMYFNDRAAFLVTRLLESQGFTALAIPSSGVEHSRTITAAFSNRHAAVAAGLGEFGLNQLCLTPDVGPRARFCSIITTAKLDPDPMYSGPKICDPDKCRKLGHGIPVCFKVCPISNFSLKKKLKVVIGEREFEYAWHEHRRCALAGLGVHPKILGSPNLVFPKNVTFKGTPAVMTKMPAQHKLEPLAFGRGHFCGLCQIRCAAGSYPQIENIMRGKEKEL
jgi:epoxyqueuosine reductase